MSSEIKWAADLRAGCIPRDRSGTASEWCEKHVMLPVSARSPKYSAEETPWTRVIVDTLDDARVQVGTIMAPVQSGKSVVGDCAVCFWGSTWTQGDIQINYEDDTKANAIWDKKTERILKACKPLMARWPANPNKAKRGLVMLSTMNLTQQGQHVPNNLASDSIRGQINEEIHGWKAGHLALAYNRTTAVLLRKILNISNAGEERDQLDLAFLAGTQEAWSFRCPCCGHAQEWRFRRVRDQNREWKPGGLVFDIAGCKRGEWDYDFEKLSSEIYYECENPECRARFRDGKERAQLSSNSHYIARNESPLAFHRSWTWDAVCVGYIPWINLVQEYTAALRRMYHGEPEDYQKFVKERESRPWDPVGDNPLTERVTLSVGETLGKAEDADFRMMTVDRQRGKMGDVPHWKIIIRSYKKQNDEGKRVAKLEYFGRIETGEEVERVREEYGVQCGREPGHARLVWVDSGDDTDTVYELCAKYGYVAIKGEGTEFYWHQTEKVKTRKVWYAGDAKKGQFVIVNTVVDGVSMPVHVPFIRYAKQGIRFKLHHFRNSPGWDWQLPSTVTEEFIREYIAEELRSKADRMGQVVQEWVKRDEKMPNDYFVLDGYQACMWDFMQTYRGDL